MPHYSSTILLDCYYDSQSQQSDPSQSSRRSTWCFTSHLKIIPFFNLSMCVCVCVPRQVVFSGLVVKPVWHWHWKEPAMFTQLPSKHTPGFTHSSTSTETRKQSLHVKHTHMYMHAQDKHPHVAMGTDQRWHQHYISPESRSNWQQVHMNTELSVFLTEHIISTASCCSSTHWTGPACTWIWTVCVHGSCRTKVVSHTLGTLATSWLE